MAIFSFWLRSTIAECGNVKTVVTKMVDGFELASFKSV
jgi:hypothetical protein